MYIIGVALIFVLVVSVDLFACALAYGTSKVHVSFFKVLVINIMGKIMITGGLVAGYFLGNVVPDVVSVWVCFAILFALGIVKLFTKQDTDKQSISWFEVLTLGVVLSVDGAVTAIGATMVNMPIAFIFAVLGISLVTDQAVFIGGQKLGNRITKKANLNLGWLSGVILITVAMVKLLLELFVL